MGALPLALSLVFAFLAGNRIPEPEIYNLTPVWEFESEDRIANVTVLADAGILVESESGLELLNESSGSGIWSLETAQLEDEYLAIPYLRQGLLLLSGRSVVAVDLATGEEVWHIEEYDGAPSLGCFPIMDSTRLLIIRGDDDLPFAELRDVGSGTVLWRDSSFCQGIEPEKHKDPFGRQTFYGTQLPVMINDTSFVTILDKRNFTCRSVATGRLIWTADLDCEKAPAILDGYAPMRIDRATSMAYLPCGRSLEAVDLRDGKQMWEDPPRFKGPVQQIEVLQEGILIRGAELVKSRGTRPYLSLIAADTGERIWYREFPRNHRGNPSPFYIRDDQAVFWAYGDIYAIDIHTGDRRRLAKGVNFDVEERPVALRLVDDGYLVIGQQTAIRLNLDGTRVYRTHQNIPPGVPFFNAYPFLEMIVLLSQERCDNAIPHLYANYSNRLGTTWLGENSACMVSFETHRRAVGNLVRVDLATGEVKSELTTYTQYPVYDYSEEQQRLFLVDKDGKQTLRAYDF